MHATLPSCTRAVKRNRPQQSRNDQNAIIRPKRYEQNLEVLTWTNWTKLYQWRHVRSTGTGIECANEAQFGETTMTDDDANELGRCLKLAKVVHDRGRDPADGTVVILGALIRAGELLAKRFTELSDAFVKFAATVIELEKAVPPEDAHDHAPGCTGLILDHGGPFECAGNGACEVEQAKAQEPSGTFPDELVERAYDASLSEGELTIYPWAKQNEPTRERARKFVGAVLAELAKALYELPAPGVLEQAARDGVLRATTNAHYAPLLATRDARIADLESRTPANEVSSAERQQYEKTIELQKQRIAELETVIDQKDACIQGKRSAVEAAEKWQSDDKARISELEKQLSEATKVPVVDGKTPGQVGHEAFLMKRFGYLAGPVYGEDVNVGEWEAVGSAVLRAFGNGAEQLREVRKRIAANYEEQTTESILETTDSHIENLEGTKVQVGRVCATCSRPEGMHYDPVAKVDTCRMFKERSDQREA